MPLRGCLEDISSLTPGGARSVLGAPVPVYEWDFTRSVNPLTDIRSGVAATLARASDGTYVDAGGVIQTASSNEARQTFDPSDGTPLGFLPEASSTNNFLRSEELDNASWGTTDVTVTANDTTAPDGQTTADEVQHDTTSSIISQSTSLTASEDICVSAFVKKDGAQWFRFRLQDGTATADSWYDITNGVLGSTATGGGGGIVVRDLEDYGDWWRVWLTASGITNAAIGFFFTLADANGSFDKQTTTPAHVWGLQLEQKRFPTSYVSTTSSTVTRAQDNCSADASFPTSHSLAVEARVALGDPISSSVGHYILSLGEGNNTTDRIFIVRNDTPLMVLNGLENSSTEYSFSETLTNGADTKIAYRQATNDFAASFDGGAIKTDTSGSPVTPLTRLHIGKRSTVGQQADAPIKSIKIYNALLPNASLEDLT